MRLLRDVRVCVGAFGVLCACMYALMFVFDLAYVYVLYAPHVAAEVSVEYCFSEIYSSVVKGVLL